MPRPGGRMAAPPPPQGKLLVQACLAGALHSADVAEPRIALAVALLLQLLACFLGGVFEAVMAFGAVGRRRRRLSLVLLAAVHRLSSWTHAPASPCAWWKPFSRAPSRSST